MIIPDLNILLYAVDADSSRHEAARSWLLESVNNGREEIGLPLVVSLGFLRLVTNPRVFSTPLSVQDALALEHDATLVTGGRDFLRFPGVKVQILF